MAHEDPHPAHGSTPLRAQTYLTLLEFTFADPSKHDGHPKVLTVLDPDTGQILTPHGMVLSG